MFSKVYVEITNICNRNCSFCPGTVRSPRRMTMEEFARIVEKLRGVTQYLYFHVMGEPLTHPLLPDMIRHAAKEGFKVAITTNGTLLPVRGQELIRAGVYKVSLSIHSFEQGADAEYLKYMEGCMDFAEMASRAGVLVAMRLWNQGYDEGRNNRTVAMLRERFPGEWREGRRGYCLRDKLHLEYGERFQWPDLAEEVQSQSVFCYGLKDHFGILCDGSVIPCCLDREGVITLGNIFETPIEEILAGERARAMREGFRRRIAQEELCQKCGYAQRF